MELACGLLWLLLPMSSWSLSTQGDPPQQTKPSAEVRKSILLDCYFDPLPADAVMRLGTLRHRYLHRFAGHDQPLPDGKTVLTSSEDEVRWVEMATGRLTRTWTPRKGQSVSGFSPDGKKVLLFDLNILHLWDLESYKELQSFPNKDKLGSVQAMFAQDGKMVATYDGAAHNLGHLRVWDISSGQELWQEEMTGFRNRGVWPIGFLPDGKTLVVQDKKENRVSIRNRATGQEQRSFPTIPPGKSRMIALSPNGQTLFVGTDGTSVRAWNLMTGKELTSLGGHKEEAHSFAISRDSKTVLTGGGDPFVLVWDWPDAKLRRKIELPIGKETRSMTVSADGKRAEIVLWPDIALRFFDLDTGKELTSSAEGHFGPIWGLAIPRDGELVSAGTDNTIRVWDLKSGRQLRKYRTEYLMGTSTLALSADGQLIASADFNRGTVAVHERKTGRLVRNLDTDGKAADSVAFAPAGNLLAVYALKPAEPGASSQPFLVFFDVETCRKVRSLDIFFDQPVFNPDGRFLAGITSNEILFLDVATGQVRQRLAGENFFSLAYSPDGRTLASGVEHAIVLWEVASGMERCRIEIPSRLAMVCQFSPDGRWLVASNSVNDDRDIFLCDAYRGQLVHSFTGHIAGVTKLAFTPDSRRLVSASYDSTLLVWDIAGVAEKLPRGQAQPKATAIAAAWNDLASADAKTAYRAIGVMIEASRQSPEFLGKRLRPVPTAKQIERWVFDLDSEDFDKRERATRELEQIGTAVETHLRRMLKASPSAEARRRAQKILDNLRGPIKNLELLRQLRAVEALESIGGNEAHEVLDMLSKGLPGARLTQEAKASLDRMAKRSAPTP